MKIISIFVFFLFLFALFNSTKIKCGTKKLSPGHNCKFGIHYRIIKMKNYFHKKFHSCICPKLKCNPIKIRKFSWGSPRQCKFGRPFSKKVGGCKQCAQCPKHCSRKSHQRGCADYKFFWKNGCEQRKCIKWTSWKRKCTKLNCKPLQCKFGVPYQLKAPGICPKCPQCRKEACPRDSKIKDCVEYAKRMENGCKVNYCKKYKPCVQLKCKNCEYGIKNFVNNSRGCAGCPICNSKPKCKKLKCKSLKCSLGTIVNKDWRGCEMCPQCKCPVNNWNLKCKFGIAYGKTNKEGCYVYKCRRTVCPKKEQPKKKCDRLWWSNDKGCETKAHCWVDPCKKLNCAKTNCTYGVFAPKDPKTGCKKCEYCEKEPKTIIKPLKIDQHDFEISKIEKIVNMI